MTNRTKQIVRDLITILARYLPLILNFYILIINVLALFNVSTKMFDNLLGHSLFLDLLLLLEVIRENKRHCKYIRYLVYNLLFIAGFDFLDKIFNFAPGWFLLLTSLTTIIAIIYFAYKSIKHYKSTYGEGQ